MSLSLLQIASAIAPGNSISFNGAGGVEPYVYSVQSGGGTINASTGVYTAPAIESNVIVRVTDAAAAHATADLKVYGPMKLFGDIIQNFMGLEDNQIYIYNQKINIPTDDKVYIAVFVMPEKPFSNTIRTAVDGMSVIQTVNFNTQLMVNILSRSTEALERRHEVIMALQSIYSKQQQALNGFAIGKLPLNMVPLNFLDGSAIPYRFNITVGFQYAVTKTSPTPYFNTFQAPVVQPDP